jgi:hypothetical protein
MKKFLYIIKLQKFIAIVLVIITIANLYGTKNAIPSKTSKVNTSIQQVLRLQVSNGTNNDEAIIIFNENASNGYDDYDSPKMSNGNVAIPEIYTMASSEQLVINGLNSITTNEVVPLGFYTGQTNTFTIRLTQMTDFNSNTKIVLKDNVLVKEFDLTSGNPYTFTSGVYSSMNRFSILFKAKLFRSKASGNWNEITTWETSYDNSSWNAANTIPTSNASSITISNGNLVTVADNATAYSLNINPQGKLTLNSGKTLNDTTLNILSDATGTGTFVDLNQLGGLTVSGTTNVKQYMTSGRNWYVSSPVKSASTSAIHTASSVQSYNEQTAAWSIESGLMVAMKGYVAVSPATSVAVTFTGTLNTGGQSIGLTRHVGVAKEGFNLVGNPYPSYVNWESAIGSEGTTYVKPTMWFRSKNAGNTAYVFDTYNALNHTGTSNNNNFSIGVTANIPPMQAFWVKVDETHSSGTLAFDNSMRVHQDQSISTNRLKSPSAANADQQVVRLQISNGTNNDETIVVFNANASNEFDDYDSQKMTNANADIPEIYTLAGTEHLVINGLNTNTTTPELLLGFNTAKANTFTIKAAEISNFDTNKSIVLRDNLLNTEQDLTIQPVYEFTSDATITETRFIINFKTKSITTEIENVEDNIEIYKNDANQIIVYSKNEDLTDGVVTIYNLPGEKLITKEFSGNKIIINMPHGLGICLVNVMNKAKVVTKKLVF